MGWGQSIIQRIRRDWGPSLDARTPTVAPCSRYEHFFREAGHFSAPFISIMFITLLLTTSCVSLLRPSGEAWTQPVDLALSADTLEGVTLEVRCLKGGENPNDEVNQESKACSDISRNLRNLGATVYYEGDDDGSLEQKKPASFDFSLAYVHRGVTADYCGWTLLPFIFTLSVFPCVQDFYAAAELQIFDENALLIERRDLGVNAVGIYGVPALYYLLVKNTNIGNLRRRNKQLGINLVRYVQNVAATYHIKRELERKHGGGAGT